MGRNAGGAGRGAGRRQVGGGAGGMDAAERNRLADVGVAALEGPITPGWPTPAPSAVVQPAAAPRQTAGILTESRKSEDDFGRVTYSFGTTEGDTVRMSVGTTGSITFSVNDSYVRGSGVSGEAANAITLRLMRHIREDARTRPEGYQYYAGASTMDGYGTQRALAYQAIGMSRPEKASPGNLQYATVRGGRLVPNEGALRSDEGDMFGIYNARWNRLRESNRRNR